MEIPFAGSNWGGDREKDLDSTCEPREGTPLPDPTEALLACFADVLAKLTPLELTTLRAEIVRHSGETGDFIEIIDGHAALRTLGALG